MLAGVATIHVGAASIGVTSSFGSSAVTRFTENSRMRGWSAAAISLSASCAWRTSHCMFDWPEPTHTSPMRTSAKRFVTVAPATTSSSGPPALPAPA